RFVSVRLRPRPRPTPFPYTTLFRSRDELLVDIETDKVVLEVLAEADGVLAEIIKGEGETVLSAELLGTLNAGATAAQKAEAAAADRKSTRLNSSHVKISYAVFCLKK